MMPTAALALIHHRDDPTFVLLVWNRKYKFFGLPGGKVEEHETPYQACIREVREEVGIHVRIHERAPVIARGPISKRLVAVFTADSWEGKPRMMEPGCPIAWATIDHLIDEDAHANAAFYTEVFSKLVFDR